MLRNFIILILKITVPPFIGFYVFAYSLTTMTSYFQKPFTEKDQKEFAVWVRGAKHRHAERMKKVPLTPRRQPSPESDAPPKTIVQVVKEARLRHAKLMKGDSSTSGRPSPESEPTAPMAFKE